jgi:hypothetical protein
VPYAARQLVISGCPRRRTMFFASGSALLENGEPVMLPFPKTLWQYGDARYERDLKRIDQWWLAHRGESWRPVRQEEPRPPVQG